MLVGVSILSTSEICLWLASAIMKSLKLFKEAQFHGAARLVDNKHKCIWILAQIIFLGCSVAVVYVTITRFFSNPTYIVKLASILPWKVFPTVIVCPEINFLQQKMDQFLSNITYPPDANITYFRSMLPQLAAYYDQDVKYNVADLEAILQLLEYNNLDVESAGIMLTPTCAETIIKCAWKARDTNCSSLFRMEVTSYGFCCVFNGRSLRRELMDPKHVKKPVEKVHINNIGSLYGLNIAVSQNITRPPVDLDLAYKWVSMRNPGNMYVDIIANGTPLPSGQEVWAGFSTESIQLTDEVRSLSRHLRRCYLINEPLKYFPEYHRRYCLLECEMERVAAQCGCALLYHPLVLGVPICSAEKLACARAATVRFGVDVCDCPMACDSDRQLVKHFGFGLEPGVPSFDPFYDGLNLTKVTIVRLYLRSYSKTVYSRRSYFSKTDLFAQLGGVFNVFFGCSVLTLLELVIIVRRCLLERMFHEKKIPYKK